MTPKPIQHPANRLAREKSPYLLQHAHNPVDWHPWGDEAFEKARSENKPILLSIGYSTCHWCHVMERETFEDPTVAGLMNRHFINIKVDREELPDVDAVYMTAVQAMTGGGGWPLNVFLTPELKPFYGGTYFPPQPAHQRPSWTQLIDRVAQAWKENPDELRKSSNQLTDAVRKISAIEPEKTALNPSCLGRCADAFARQFDAVHGGFGAAPKFPRPSVLYFLTRLHARTGDAQALHMAAHTLRRMARGGIYDQLGGGFARYSVDEEWLVPHFEKMLYDNAQLAVCLLDVSQLTGDDFFAGIATETLEYVRRDMTHPEGGFYSAEDADSEGIEGRFYVWTKSEIDSALPREEAAIFNAFFGVTEAGNFQEGGAAANILSQVSSLPQIAQTFHLTGQEAASRLESAARTLLKRRSSRTRPHLDDKVLTSWNGLMISAFSRAAQVLGSDGPAEAASRAAAFVETRLVDPRTRGLFHRWRDGEVGSPSFHSDYAFYIQGLLDLYETSFDPRWLHRAIELAEIEAREFYDSQAGGFFMTPTGTKNLLLRVKDDSDNAEPSSNSAAVSNLLRLYRITGRAEYRQRAQQTLELFAGRLNNAPFAVPQMAAAYALSLEPPLEIVIAGERDRVETRELVRAAHAAFLPCKTLLLVDEASRGPLAALQPALAGLRPIEGKPAAYVCENFACRLPLTQPSELRETLAKTAAARRHSPPC